MKTYDMIVQELLFIHQWLLDATEGLTVDQFSRVLSSNAPPIGWHLWHIARFADRLQASFLLPSGDGSREIWDEEGLAQHWKLELGQLGVLESGMEMDLEVAASLPVLVGKDRIQDYATRSFGKVDQMITKLDTAQFDEPRMSVRAYKSVGEKLVEATPDKTTTGADLVFHVSHASEHLGSIEALHGAIK